jgi:hypothetical protein
MSPVPLFLIALCIYEIALLLYRPSFKLVEETPVVRSTVKGLAALRVETLPLTATTTGLL